MNVRDLPFCPRCGKKVVDKKDHLYCSACNLKNYKHERACAGVIPVTKDGQILLIERAFQPGKGKLDIVGGFINEGETLEMGAKREALEELNFQTDKLHYVGSYSHLYSYQKVGYWVVTAVFVCQLKNGEKLAVKDDVSGYTLYDIQNIPYEKLAFPEQRPIFDQLREIKWDALKS